LQTMSTKKLLVLLGVLIAATVLITACAGAQGEPGPAGPAGPAGPQGEPGPAAVTTDLTCTECHNDTSLISSKKANWQESLHGQGTAFIEEGGNKNCAFCHSGATFSASVAKGLAFNAVESGDANPTHQDCRTCHQIHTSYTSADWALETNAAVTFVVSGATFDGGSGNLCANCHQARRYIANFVAKDSAGVVIPDKYQANVRFNTHLSDQGDIILGVLDVNEILGVEGKPGAHYSMVENTCVGCHMGGSETANHRFRPEVTACVACHADAESLDVNGAVTAFEEKYAELHDALVAEGLLNEDGSPVTKNADGTPLLIDTKPAAALFVYGALEEDASKGVHNPNYAKALIEAALAALAE